MTTTELTKWLRDNASGVYRPAAEAADLIEMLMSGLDRVDRHMQGDQAYEHSWANYPEKPEKSPAIYVRELLERANPI